MYNEKWYDQVVLYWQFTLLLWIKHSDSAGSANFNGFLGTGMWCCQKRLELQKLLKCNVSENMLSNCKEMQMSVNGYSSFQNFIFW